MADFEISQDKKSMRIEGSLFRLKDINKHGIRQGFYQVGVISKDIIKENISKLPRFGAIGYYKGRKRRASLPGESFANRSGDAKNTLGFDVRGSNYLEVGFRKNSKTIYTKILEDSKNRPTLEIASKQISGNAQTIFLQEIEKSHKKGIE